MNPDDAGNENKNVNGPPQYERMIAHAGPSLSADARARVKQRFRDKTFEKEETMSTVALQPRVQLAPPSSISAARSRLLAAGVMAALTAGLFAMVWHKPEISPSGTEVTAAAPGVSGPAAPGVAAPNPAPFTPRGDDDGHADPNPKPRPTVFETPEAALKALLEAVSAADVTAMQELLHSHAAVETLCGADKLKLLEQNDKATIEKFKQDGKKMSDAGLQITYADDKKEAGTVSVGIIDLPLSVKKTELGWTVNVIVQKPAAIAADSNHVQIQEVQDLKKDIEDLRKNLAAAAKHPPQPPPVVVWAGPGGAGGRPAAGVSGVGVAVVGGGGGGTAAEPQSALEGRVLAVKADVKLVMISLGTQQNFKPGDLLDVFHGEKKLGQLKIEKAYPDMSSARYVDVNGDVENNDVVKLAVATEPAAQPARELTADERKDLVQAVQDLGSEDFATRDDAKKRLAKAGAAARDILETGVKSDDAERSHTCKDLLEALSNRGQATANSRSANIRTHSMTVTVQSNGAVQVEAPAPALPPAPQPIEPAPESEKHDVKR